MGFSLKKAVNSVTKAVKSVVNSDVGKAINPYNALATDALGIKQSDGYAIGGTVGSAMFLNSLLNVGGLSASDMTQSNNSGFLSSILGGDGFLGSVVKGAVGLGSDYLSNKQQLKNQMNLNNQTLSQNRALADEAYQRDVAMWNLQNAYNAPSAQMERLKSAGLNPNLVYGSGNVTGNTAGSPPSYPHVTAPTQTANKLDYARNILGIFNEYQSIKNQALENQRQNAMMFLRARALDLQDKRVNQQLQLALANLDLRRQQFEYLKNKPDVYDRSIGILGKLFDFGSNIGEKIGDSTFGKLYDWWHRPIKHRDDVPELF